MSDEHVRRMLQRIEDQIRELSNKIDLLIQARIRPPPEIGGVDDPPLDIIALLGLPDHLRKTAMAMNDLREATAQRVSTMTGRKRATESDCLNQLLRLGYLNKRRQGLEVVFFFGE